MTQRWQLPLSIIALIATSPQAVAQQQSEEDELAAAYGSNKTVSIATGTQQPINKAPSSASVITAEDIKASGANDLREALENVAGLHVSFSGISYYPRYFVRGIGSEFNPELLFLVNGVKRNTQFHGNTTLLPGSIPLQNVSRIEIIRGPGSALYGADAFSGVVNIITKSADEIPGLEFGVRAGSHTTKESWFQYGGTIGAIKTAFYLRYNKTDGQKGLIERDGQSGLDTVFNTRASLAPGPLSLSATEVDANLDMSYGNWRARINYEDRANLGIGSGLGNSLDPAARAANTRTGLDITYKKSNLLPNLDIDATYSYYQLVEPKAKPAYTIFPAGAFGGLFPSGFIGNPGHSERHYRLGFSALYNGFTGHRVRAGIGRDIEDLYETVEDKNFIFNPGLTPLGRIISLRNYDPFIYLSPQKRTSSYVFVQDEWKIAKDWNLTAGVRRDHYSDFGNTTNPRLALVWDAAYNLTLKALYGAAFRAPAFTEQYNQGSPVANGNPHLQPEKIKTTELGIVWAPKPAIRTSLTLYHYRQSDIILFVPDPGGNGTATARNTGDQTGRGAELETNWDISRTLRLTGNYSFQRSTDEASGKDAGLAPHQRLFFRSDWQFSPGWQFGATVNYVGDRRRQPGDNRLQIADYTLVDLNLNYKIRQWEFKATVNNLFNRNAREPSLTPGDIPFDLPIAKRSFYLQAVYTFK